jgi:signal transduction histidine kinase
VNDTTDAVTEELAIGLPVIILVVALTSRLVVGWALFPVEAMRREVDEISSAELHRRVPYAPGDDEFARLSRTMNRMLDRLEEAQRRQRRLVSDASHELRSPVAGVRQHAEVALQHPEGTDATRFAETVLAQSIRLQRLIDDLLLLAKADEDALPRAGAPVDLDDLVFAEADRLRSTSALRIHTAEVSAGRVDADPGGLARVLVNLGENAARHARTQVWFALGYQDGRVVLTVDDDGEGIPEQDRQRVLERFVRLDEGRARDVGGSGLGLAIVHELVAADGGEIRIEDSPHGGARVVLVFPASTDPGDDHVLHEAAEESVSADTRRA